MSLSCSGHFIRIFQTTVLGRKMAERFRVRAKAACISANPVLVG
jgi:hypothetical protein